MATSIDGLRVGRQAREAGLLGATLAGFATITTFLAGAQPRALPDPLSATAANVLATAKTAIMQFDAVLQATGLPPTAANLTATTAIFLVPAAIGMVVGRTGTVAAHVCPRLLQDAWSRLKAAVPSSKRAEKLAKQANVIAVAVAKDGTTDLYFVREAGEVGFKKVDRESYEVVREHILADGGLSLDGAARDAALRQAGIEGVSPEWGEVIINRPVLVTSDGGALGGGDGSNRPSR